jgi:hypothetical protein
LPGVDFSHFVLLLQIAETLAVGFRQFLAYALDPGAGL